MYQISSMFQAVSKYYMVAVWMVLTVFCVSFGVSAQQPTATISSLSGNALVSFQGQEAIPATIGAELRPGDIIQTQAGTEIVLTLSDGSELLLGENANLDISALSAQPETNIRTSRVKLLWGRVRAFLSPNHQQEGSSFTIETPNALVGVKFSQPDVEVIHSPPKTTVACSYTFDASVTNLVTGETVLIFPRQCATVEDDRIIVTSVEEIDETTPSRLLQLATRRSLLLGTRNIFSLSTGNPVTDVRTNQNPVGTDRSGRAERRQIRPRIGIVTIVVTEEAL
jgi:hypothetical protein